MSGAQGILVPAQLPEATSLHIFLLCTKDWSQAGLAGLVVTRALSEVQRLWTRVVEGDPPESAGGRHDARDWQERSEGQNSNELAARALAGYILGRCLTREELRFAAPLMQLLADAAAQLPRRSSNTS